MRARQVLGSIGIAILFAVAQGCYRHPNEGSGVSEADLKKIVEQKTPNTPKVLEFTAAETIERYTDPRAAQAPPSSKDHPHRVVGNVLERGPDEADAPYVILDGGIVEEKTYKIKCLFPADQREAVKKVKKGEEVRIEGKCDGQFKDNTLEFTQCSFFESSSPTPAKPDPSP